MSKASTILVVVIAFSAQFALVVPATMHDQSFRHQQRLDAHKAMVDNPTPVTKAAFEQEMQLEQYHRTHDQFIRGVYYFGVLVFFEGICSYFWIRHRKRKSAR